MWRGGKKGRITIKEKGREKRGMAGKPEGL